MPHDMNPSMSSTSIQSPPMVIDSEGIQPQPAHERGQSSPSIVTVDAFAAQQADISGHKTASSSAAKKVMDWFRRKSIAKDTLVNLKTAGVKSDSVGSFVRVSNGPARGAPNIAGSTLNLAMSSTSSIANIAEGNPNITVTEAAPADEAPSSVSQQPNEMPEPVRLPLRPATDKVNIVLPAGTSTASLLSPSQVDSLPMPSRSKSHQAADTAPVRTTPAITPARVAAQPAAVRSADDARMRVHTGLVDQSALSSRPPSEVIAEVLLVLHGMGIEIKKENEFRLRCTRVRRRKAGPTTGLGLGSVMSVGSGMSPFSLMSSASTGRVGFPLRMSAHPLTPARPTLAVYLYRPAHQAVFSPPAASRGCFFEGVHHTRRVTPHNSLDRNRSHSVPPLPRLLVWLRPI